MNQFQELTIKGLSEGLETKFDFSKYKSNGFNISDDDLNKEECVLVIGLNPAGDEGDAERESTNKLYLYSYDKDLKFKSKNKRQYSNNTYFRPIMDLVNSTTSGGAKWVWSKGTIEEIESMISQSNLEEDRESILEQYRRDQTRKVTIYCGDMFYVHKTDSRIFKFKKRWDAARYCRKMLDLHIQELKRHNKIIKYVYINNGFVSSILKQDDKPYIRLDDGTYVFLGMMLSSISATKNRFKEYILEVMKKELFL